MVAFAELPVPPGTRFGPVRLVPETGSTNADLLALAAAGEAEGSVLVTDHQRAGRGRQRRVWHDEPGNSLLVSVLLRHRVEIAPLLPLVAGLAAIDAVTATFEEVTGDPVDQAGQAGLKWPNDVLVPGLGERKLAGILAEASSGRSDGRQADRALVVVVGLGLNLRWVTPPPAEIEQRVVTLTELCGRPVERDRVLASFLGSFERWLVGLERGEPVLDAYRQRCLTIGREVSFTSAGVEYRGRAVDVSDRGTLLLDTVDGERVELNAGDAHHV